jgi:hypothetical protein
MSVMQKRLYIGRTLSCNRCAKPFAITEDTPDPVPAPSVRAWVPQAQQQPVAPPTGAPTTKMRPTGASGEGLTAGRMALLITVIIAVVSFLLYAAIAPSVHRAREASRRAACASNLTQIGFALSRYATNNGGNFPNALDALVLDGSLPAELLICPSATADTAAPGQTPAEQAANLPKGKHLSYVYVGKGVSFMSPKQVVVYEPLAHHDNEGVNALYSDGTVQFLPRPAALTAIPQLAPGGAPTTTTTAPAAQPAGPPAPGR